ncbi:MAG: hypothetical protein POELPBGB_03401 [Bacteroidia bacterium]|nr:hypothetical protein [Bacteroidia bacterium]
MENKFQLYQQVQLSHALPEHHFEKGDIATIVEIVKDKNNNTGYLLEFFDNNGQTLKVIAVAEADIALPPQHAVVNYRPYLAA